MASEDDLINMTACREVLRSFSLCETETSVEGNLQQACAHHDSLMCQQVAAEDAPEMAQLLDAKMQSMCSRLLKRSRPTGHASGCSLTNAAPSNGEGGRAGEGTEEAQQFNGQTSGHILRSSPEQQSPPTSPPYSLAQLRGKVEDVLPGTVNTVRGAVERVGQVPDLVNLPTLRGDVLEDILAEHEQEEVPVTPQRQVQFSTLTPIVRPVEQPREMTQSSRVSQVPSVEQSLLRHPETKRDLCEEGFSHSLQAAATEFKKLHEPKVAKFKGGYSSNTSLAYQSWLKDIWVYTIECHLSQ